MTPLGEAHRRDARSYPLGATKFTTRDDDSNEDGDDLSGPDTDDEEVSSQPETREDALDIDSDDDLASDDASDDEDDTEVAEEVRRQINTTQGSTIVPPVENAFVPLPRTSTTRSLGTFHTILPGAPVLRLTPSTSSSVSQTPSATRNASPFQAFSSTTTRIISPQVPTTTPSAPLLSNTLLPSSTPAPPIPSVITNTSTGASSLPTTQASAEATAGAAAGGGLNGGAVAGAAVGGAAALALVATGIFFFKKRRRQAAETTSGITRKESIRRAPPPAEMTPAATQAPLTPSAFKFNFNAPRMPRDQWPQSMEILNSRVQAEYAAHNQREAQNQGYQPQDSYDEREEQNQGYYQSQDSYDQREGQNQGYYQPQDSYEARVYMQ